MVFPTLSADTTFHLGALAKSKRGQTYATLNSTCNAVFQLTGFDAPLHVPFAAGVYQEKGDETRINLDVVIEGELLQVFDALDKQFETMLESYNQKSQYHPMVTKSEHGARLRIKVNTEGPKKALMYNMKKERLGGIRDVQTAGAYVVPVVAFTKEWWMTGQHGITMELRHCVIADPPGPDFDWPMDTTSAETPF